MDLTRPLSLLTGERVLVTGAAGSIGTEVVRVLRDAGGSPRATDVDQLDVRLRSSVQRVFGLYRPTVVFHLAGAKHAPEGERDPQSVLEVNAVGTENVITAATVVGARVVTASTCKACDPETAYGASKLLAERLTLAAGGNVARFYNVVETAGNVFDTPEVDAGWLRPLVDAIDDGVVLASGVAAGQTGAHPVESPVVAIAPPVFTAVGGCPPVRDMYALPALCAEAARHGRLGVVRESVVAPASRRLGPPRHHRGGGLELSIVIPTLHAGGERVRSCLHAIAVTTADPHEVIVVDNGSSPQGYTEPVNAGIRAAAGRYVVVMNDDVEALPGWWPPLRAGLDAGAPVTFPTTIDTAMRTDFAAWCFALSQATIDRFGVARGQFFDARFSVWYQDTDLLVRLRQAGLPPVLVPESRIRHALSQTVNTAVPELAAWIRREVARDQQRFQEKHPQMAITPLGT